ncbi:homoserine dehydrogenase [Chitinimonas sp. BJB300]|uniref:homoserine dehydrogenase n=1 Tax=Chitinimonas sp. BJB300 TaxID=1559339 RepID=UPI000C0F8CAC|nr:homoserine dehydrogenase [Chitinimonas sp. BJB300]PHV11119.1 homoserine dehydrogenase [Chitinimonas sp. BJB300]TSJ88248.1 homoserine dehydrogenase [Chitinimonas sp. BJB300]
MEEQRIAVIGLGRIGSAFLQQILQRRALGITLVCAVEPNNTPGRRQAEEAGIAIRSVDDIIALREQVDIIFELTGVHTVRRDLREKLKLSGNLHTIVAPEAILRMMWALLTSQAMPECDRPAGGY